MASTVTGDTSPGSEEASLAPGTEVRGGPQTQGPSTELGLCTLPTPFSFGCKVKATLPEPMPCRGQGHSLVLVIHTQHLF